MKKHALAGLKSGSLIAPAAAFDEVWRKPPGAGPFSARHASRAALAMEVAHQLAKRVPGLVLKGGTPLQARLNWPPRRASVDVDVETKRVQDIVDAVEDLASSWSDAGVTMGPKHEDRFSHVTYLRAPFGDDEELSVRVDISPPGSSTLFSEQWLDAPPPWRGSADIRVPTLEAQAAQKLLLAAPPDFGRDLRKHQGRQGLCKDLFDTYSLGALDLDSAKIRRAATKEIELKGGRIGWSEPLPRVIDGAKEALRRLAQGRADTAEADKELWRAFDRVNGTFLLEFTDAELRIAAGCSYFCISAISSSHFDWGDAWEPRRSGRARKAWSGGGVVRSALLDARGLEGPRGVLEAWADEGPPLSGEK